jgi:hypothetical protein
VSAPTTTTTAAPTTTSVSTATHRRPAHGPAKRPKQTKKP